MVVLEKLLASMKAAGSRVLIFCLFRQYLATFISCSHQLTHNIAISTMELPRMTVLVRLTSITCPITRSLFLRWKLGINLITADIAVFATAIDMH
jgi:hypothetical protein